MYECLGYCNRNHVYSQRQCPNVSRKTRNTKGLCYTRGARTQEPFQLRRRDVLVDVVRNCSNTCLNSIAFNPVGLVSR